MKETIDQFLARGGVITVVPTVVPEAKPDSIRSMVPSAPVPRSLSEHDLYHGEKSKVKTSTPKSELTIDFSALPKALQDQYRKRWEELNDDSNED